MGRGSGLVGAAVLYGAEVLVLVVAMVVVGIFSVDVVAVGFFVEGFIVKEG